jgi:hypothetical protein
MTTRKTAKQKQEQEFNAWWREQSRFEQRVRELESLKEAVDFVESGPRSSEPGGVLYTHLGAFLNGFNPPDAADWERQLYAEFLQRLSANRPKAR